MLLNLTAIFQNNLLVLNSIKNNFLVFYSKKSSLLNNKSYNIVSFLYLYVNLWLFFFVIILK